MCKKQNLKYSGLKKEGLVDLLTNPLEANRKELTASQIGQQLQAALNKLRSTNFSTKSVLHVSNRKQNTRGPMPKPAESKLRSNSSAQQQTLLVTFPDLTQQAARQEAISRFAEMLQREPPDPAKCTEEPEPTRSEKLKVVLRSVGNGPSADSRVEVDLLLGQDEAIMAKGLMAHCGPRFHMVGECGDRGEGAERHTKTCSLLASVLAQLVRPASEVAALEMLGRNGEDSETAAECWQGRLEEQRTKKLPEVELEVAGRLTGLGWDMLLDHAPKPPKLKSGCNCGTHKKTQNKKDVLAACVGHQCGCKKDGKQCGAGCGCDSKCCQNQNEIKKNSAGEKKQKKWDRKKNKNAWIEQHPTGDGEDDIAPVRPVADEEECRRQSLNLDSLWSEVIAPIFKLNKLRCAK
jgi:hypothetical protein